MEVIPGLEDYLLKDFVRYLLEEHTDLIQEEIPKFEKWRNTRTLKYLKDSFEKTQKIVEENIEKGFGPCICKIQKEIQKEGN